MDGIPSCVRRKSSNKHGMHALVHTQAHIFVGRIDHFRKLTALVHFLKYPHANFFIKLREIAMSHCGRKLPWRAIPVTPYPCNPSMAAQLHPESAYLVKTKHILSKDSGDSTAPAEAEAATAAVAAEAHCVTRHDATFVPTNSRSQ